jgi:DNA anti-recombination protein RmuC
MTLTEEHLLTIAGAMAACFFIAMLIAIWKAVQSSRASALGREERVGLERELAEVRRQLQDGSSQERENTSRFHAQGKALSEATENATAFKIKAEESNKRSEELRQRLGAMEESRDQLQRENQSLSTEFAELKTSLDEREKNYESQLAQLNAQEEKLAKHFKLLANEILDTKTRAMQETNKASLTSIMAPFQQSIDGFKKEVQDIHHRETTQRGELKKELENLKELNQKITTEAHELSTALRGQKKLQGNWGELVLEMFWTDLGYSWAKTISERSLLRRKTASCARTLWYTCRRTSTSLSIQKSPSQPIPASSTVRMKPSEEWPWKST